MFVFLFSVNPHHSDDQFDIFVGDIVEVLGPNDATGLGKLRKTQGWFVDTFLTDVPWGLIKGNEHDVKIPAASYPHIIQWMISFFRPKAMDGDGTIGIRLDDQDSESVYHWSKAMKDEGMFVQTIRISDTPAQAQSRCSTYLKTPAMTTTGHCWLIGKMCYIRKYKATAPFGTSV